MRFRNLLLSLSLLPGVGGSAPITVYLAGDSTMAEKRPDRRPETGWGEYLQQFFDESQVRIANRAINGRSTRSFMEEGSWKAIVDSLKPGDYVFIQFGHNDEAKDRADRYTPPDDYRRNLIRMVREVRSKKASPVLFTSVRRRKFDDSGQLVDTHGEYPGLVLAVAAEEQVPVIDMHRTSGELLQRYGSDSSKALFLQLKPGEHSNYPAGVTDNTHFRPLGAELMAQLAVDGIRASKLGLGAWLRSTPTRAVDAPAPGATVPAITEADLSRRLFLIAADSMMGRESGSAGDFKTADYIAAEFRRLGLEPAGEHGTYFQTVPFWRVKAGGSPTLRAGADRIFEMGRDFMPASFGAPPRTLDHERTIFGGPATDSARWISAERAAGKVVVLDFTPGTSLGGAVFASPRWRNARAIVAVALDQTGAERLSRLRDGRPVADSSRNPRAIPLLLFSRRAAVTLLGADPATLEPGASGLPLSGTIDMERTPVEFPARNVIAILRGADAARRGSYIALTAHNDHVGFDHSPVDHDSIRAFNRVVRPMGADSPARPPTADESVRIRTILDSLRRVHKPRLDSIRNGADDDGSGTVSILEIAEAMARGGARPARSVLFVSHTGEEDGLVGSRWFTDHPTVPLDSIFAEIDQDMVGRGTPTDFPRNGTGAGSATYLEVIGARRLSREFGDTLEAVNARQPVPFSFDYTFDAPGHPLQYYCRADHYSYARYGIPSVAFSRGEHLDYHQVTDEAQYISYPDLARVAKMVHQAAMALAAMPSRPVLVAAKPLDPHGACRQ